MEGNANSPLLGSGHQRELKPTYIPFTAFQVRTLQIAFL